MPVNATVTAADLELLRKYDTPTVCNVVELFDVRSRTAGYMDGRIKACYPALPPMVGFTSGTICAHGYCQIVQVGIPIHVGGVMVHDGDLLHGDRNGVTTIPLEVASATAKACADYMAAEQVILDYLRAGKVDPQGFTKARNECKDHLAALEKRLKSGL